MGCIGKVLRLDEGFKIFNFLYGLLVNLFVR